MENLELLTELLEASSHACNCFIKGEIALNDGEVEECQKANKEGQVLLNALIKDTFLEIEEMGENDGQTNEYDYPNNLQLIKSLNEVCMQVGALLCADENIKKIVLPKLFKAINTSKEIYLALFEN